MAGKSSIEWTDATWNPVRGCSRVSPGCGGPNHEGGCYAEKIAARFSDPGQPYHGFAERTEHGGRWTSKLALIEGQLMLPLRWKKPRRIFVNSMSDLFHEALPDEAIDKIFAVMALCPQHTFQVLTKRPERMRDYFARKDAAGRWVVQACRIGEIKNLYDFAPPEIAAEWTYSGIPNVWLGVSCERQQEADERIPLLLQTPAAVRFISAEPLLGPIDLNAAALATRLKLASLWPPPSIDWVIVGGESGKDARPFHIEWGDSLIAQCKAADVACFVKQLGACAMSDGYPVHLPTDRKGGDWSQWPERLRVREFPDAARSAGTLTEPVEFAGDPLS